MLKSTSTTRTYGSGVIEILEDCLVDFNWVAITVVHGNDKVEEVAFSHVLWRLLLELGWEQLVMGPLPALVQVWGESRLMRCYLLIYSPNYHSLKCITSCERVMQKAKMLVKLIGTGQLSNGVQFWLLLSKHLWCRGVVRHLRVRAHKEPFPRLDSNPRHGGPLLTPQARVQPQGMQKFMPGAIS